jgi:hypothetical protein
LTPLCTDQGRPSPPFSTPAVWKLVTPLLDAQTYDAITFLSSPSSLCAELEKVLPAAAVPDFLGGVMPTPEAASGTLRLANGDALETSVLVGRLS